MMRDYPSIPNVFRVNSACNLNSAEDGIRDGDITGISCPLQSAVESNGRGTHGGGMLGSVPGHTQAHVGGCPGDFRKSAKRNYPENVDTNGGINYRNNSASFSPLVVTTQRNPTEIGHNGPVRDCVGALNTTRNSLKGVNNNNNNTNNNNPAIQAKITALTGNNNSSGSDLNSLNSADGTILPPAPIRRTTSSSMTKRITDEKSGYFLWIITPVAASFSVAIVVAALAGPQWLFTEEKLPNSNYNGTANFNVKDDGAFITKYTKSSLWILCSTLQAMESYNCIKIDYFPKEEYRTDPLDSTLAIPYTVARSAPFFLVSGVVLVVSFVVFLVAMCSHQNSLYYFTSGILFIVSGLLMLIGLIVYISIFKAEIGSKLRPKSTLQPPLFTFTYGQSFFLYVFGFVSTEFVGVLNIFLFISLQQVGQYKTIPCLSFVNSGGHKDVEKNNRHRLRPFENETSFICKKHSAQSNTLYSSDMEKRYYFEKPQKCDIHSRNFAKSLNELYTEPAPNFSHFDLPQEFPLTRSVSTTTEIFANGNGNSNNGTHNSNTLDKRNQKNQSNESKDHLNDICGLSRGILGKRRKSKDELFLEFCKRAGMRPKPKDIYYIDDSGGEDNDSVYIVDNYANYAKNRRSSFIEPKKRNSSSSLRPMDKVYPKSLFDLDRCEAETWNNYPDPYFNKNKSHDLDFYHSRTLPRCFMKRNFETYDHEMAPKNQQPLFHGSTGFCGSSNMFRKSFDDVHQLNLPPQNHRNNNFSMQWPATIPASPSSFSTKSVYHPSLDRARCPSAQKLNRACFHADHPQRQLAFDIFDLDEIERERRKSHASLFDLGLGYDLLNGTAV